MEGHTPLVAIPMPEPSPSRLRILLVEDLPLHRKIIPLRLGPLGREIAAVASADDAAGFLTQHLPDLILLDVIMPRKDGFTFCRELKADMRTRYVSVVMLTDLKADAHERSIEAGADDYLPKRVDDAVLRIRVRLHLLLQHLRMQGAGSSVTERPLRITLLAQSPSLQQQLPAQFALDGHHTRILPSWEALEALADFQDDLLVVDAGIDAEGLTHRLAMLRSDPSTAQTPVALLCERPELSLLPDIETMVDDVLWKPLNARVTRFRLRLLQELALRSRIPVN